MRNIFLGIDLGTTNCRVAVINRRLDPNNETIENLDIPQFIHDRRMCYKDITNLPSVVYFDSPTDSYVGQYAKQDMLVRRPEQTVRSIKRLMGRTWTYSPFPEMTPKMNWSPEGISAILLRKLKLAIEANKEISNIKEAVITVPASFDNRQREATKDAAALAGFDREKITLIDEPTAAILDYVFSQINLIDSYISLEKPQNILVFDMGGGTCDVSIVKTEPQKDGLSFTILARSRYTELAGNDFDLKLAAYLLNIFQQHNGKEIQDLTINQQREAFSTLLELSEDLKVSISKRLWECMVYFEDLAKLEEVVISHPGRKIEYGEDLIGKVPPLTLGYFSHFERIWKAYFNPDRSCVNTIYAPINSALEEAFPDIPDPRKNVDLILLHGGMCKLKVIGAKVKDYFPDNIRVAETPDLMNSVARGAAIYDVMLNGSSTNTFGKIRMRKQPVFESVFWEHYGSGLQEIIPKTAAPGDEKEIELLKVPKTRPSRIPVSLYHGFRPDDPFVTLDQELTIDFHSPPKEGDTVYLRWRILEDRTIEYKWRLENGELLPLRRLASQGRGVSDNAQDLDSQKSMLKKINIY